MDARPLPSSLGVSARMSRHPRRDTGPELALRQLLHAAGFRYRVQYPVPGMPRRSIDVAFTRARVAVFVDGCFWHGCPEHGQTPKANNVWWLAKLRKNRERDAGTDACLEAQGWLVLRFWEHTPPPEAREQIARAVNLRLAQARRSTSARSSS